MEVDHITSVHFLPETAKFPFNSESDLTSLDTFSYAPLTPAHSLLPHWPPSSSTNMWAHAHLGSLGLQSPLLGGCFL